ncbi:MAG: tRNA (adenosine(37)-N6)-dimethylallyltransferase MiaA [Melioribacteraceae bacterium]|nr:tRNA (adenosine(37)-N6)-dimethylallyltransferase MiaA [Melioribacteraceae bacterium]
MLQKLVVILGPTAVGKTNFAVKLAKKFNGEIISADSRQVYKGMDIGTGKDLSEYQIDNVKIPYHLIDIVEPSVEYNLFSFQNDFYSSFNQIISNNKQPFLVGGTGLYIHSILKEYNLHNVNFNSERAKELNKLTKSEVFKILKNSSQSPTNKTQLHNTTDLIDKERIIKAVLIREANSSTAQSKVNIKPIVIEITETREIIKERITARLKLRLQNGMIEEVENLISSGVSYDKLNFFGLEYRLVSSYIKGELTYNDMYQKLNSAIHKFAKKQMTWFRKMEREGVEINWLKANETDKAYFLITKFLDR